LELSPKELLNVTANVPGKRGFFDLLRLLKRRYVGFGGGINDYEYHGDRPDLTGLTGDFEKLFWNKKGAALYKWHHYFSIYEKHFAAYRNTPVKFLEIGVAKGGSLEVWRDYFGPEAVIYGIDILPECARFNGAAGQVRIGSQADSAFLKQVIEEMGGVDLVLDDGSHDSHHIRKTFRTLFPAMSVGGVYMIEDLHAAYWSSFSGGYRKASSFLEDVKDMIDDMHHWYHYHGVKIPEAADLVAGMHIYDSIVAFDRGKIDRPQFSWSGDKED
jgi:hypothetical protein